MDVADYNDDLLGFLGVESISDVTFFSRVQIADVVFHSRAYKRVSRRNNYTFAYWQRFSICYGQIEVFFVTRDERRMACEAVVSTMSMSGRRLCKWYDILGSPVSHIVSPHHPNRRRLAVVPLDEIVDVCVYMKFTDSDLSCAPHFANHIERD